MSVLVVGLSHRTAPVSLLERAALDGARAGKLALDVLACPSVDEAVVLSTCNRVEVYARVGKFHGGVREISSLLSAHADVDLEALTPHLYVHYEDRAVHHVFSVACGLDSMVVGESQILGQVRGALRAAQEAGTAGSVLNELLQQALRVGKRAHAETGIDRAAPSLVGVGLELAQDTLGSLEGRPALVIGAGSMSALAATLLRRAGVGDLVIVNRSVASGARLAERMGARYAPLHRLSEELPAADIVVSCTGAVGTLVSAEAVARAPRAEGRAQFFLDLALPRDVEAAVRSLPGRTLIDLEHLAGLLGDEPGRELRDGHGEGQGHRLPSVGDDVAAVKAIVAEEVAAFLSWQHAASVAPTVVALRSMAAEVVEGELARLAGRLPDLSPHARDEVALTVRRVVDKLLHAPTMRVKQLAGDATSPSYAEALRELFDLDPAAVAVVSRVDLPEHASDAADAVSGRPA